MRRLLVVAWFGGLLFGQAPVIDSVRALPNGNVVEVVFKPGLFVNDEDLDKVKIQCKLTSPIEMGEAKLVEQTVAQFALTGRLAEGSMVSVECASVQYLDKGVLKTATGLKASVKVETAVAADKAFQAIFEKVRKAAKKSSEKDLFASGFVTTATAGSAGGADISINPEIKIPNVTTFIQLKKTTQEGGDAKNFEAGARYSKFFITNRQGFQALQGKGNLTTAQALKLFEEQRSKSAFAKAFAGSSLDMAAKMEGAAGSFDVTNFVGDGAYTLRTNTLGLFGGMGFFRGFLTPGGIELGQSQGRPEMLKGAPVEWIARYKTGLGFRLFFKDSSSLLRQVELSGDGVVRNLFEAESMWDAKTKSVSRTGKGVRAYGQIDLKVYLGENEKVKYGVKLTYNRGSLPPVFARVRSFQFGFLVESAEDKQ
jgi:hypothetical protein